MSSGNTVVIDVVAQVTDETAQGANSATRNVSRLERSMQRVQQTAERMRRMSRIELTMFLIDRASRGINAIFRYARRFAGRVFSATFSIVDRVTQPIRRIMSRIGDLIGIAGIASTVLGGLTVANSLGQSGAYRRQSSIFDRTTANVGIDSYGQAAMRQHGYSLQRDMGHFSDLHFMSLASQMTNYMTDYRAIMALMEPMADLAMFQSHGQGMSVEDFADLSSYIQRIMYDARERGNFNFAGRNFVLSDEQRAILESDTATELDRALAISDALSRSMGGLAREANMDRVLGTAARIGTTFSYITREVGERLRPSVGSFLSMFEQRMPNIGRLIERGASGLNSWFERAIPSIERGIDRLIVGAERLGSKISNIFGREDFQDAGLFGQIRILWDEIIWQPFQEWWSSRGQSRMESVASSIGSGIGGAITWGISALFGLDPSGALEDGSSIGRSFAQGFSDAFDGEQIADAFMGALKRMWDWIKGNPIAMSIAALWTLGKGLGLISGGYKAITGAMGVFKGVSGALGGSAALAGLAPAGTLGAAGMGAAAFPWLGAAGGALGAVGLVSAGRDFYRSFQTEDAAEAAALRGSAGWQAGGVLSGAAMGAMIGSVVPIIGTAIGGLIGAGIGFFGGRHMSNRRMAQFEEEQAAEEYARQEELRMREQFRLESLDGLHDRFGDVRLSLLEIQSIARGLVFHDAEESMMAFADATNQAQRDMQGLQRATLDFERMQWRAGLGLYWSEEDARAYAQAARQVAMQAEQALESTHFQSNMALRLLGFDDESAMATQMRSGFTAMQERLSGYTSELDILLAGGVLTLDKEAEVQRLMGQIAEINQMMAASQVNAELDFLSMRYGGANMDLTSFGSIQEHAGRLREEASTHYEQAARAAVGAFRSQFDAGMMEYDTFQHHLSAIGDSLQDNLISLDNRIFDFQMDQLIEAFGEEFAHYEGDLREKLTSAFAAVLESGPDVEGWSNYEWMALLGLDDEGAGLGYQMGAMFTSMATTVSSQFGENLDVPAHLVTAMMDDVQASIDARELTATVNVRANMSGFNSSMGAINASNPGSVRSAWSNVGFRAEGGIITRPELSWIGEDGDEAVIPLSAGRRSRGLALWQQAGEMLGVQPGGLTEPLIQTPSVSSVGGSGVAPVNIGGIKFDIHVDGSAAANGDDLVQAIANNLDVISDKVAYNLSLGLEKVYANMPLSAH